NWAKHKHVYNQKERDGNRCSLKPCRAYHMLALSKMSDLVTDCADYCFRYYAEKRKLIESYQRIQMDRTCRKNRRNIATTQTSLYTECSFF
ncbi:hypothetical protein L9F63_025726, partial [Diploptera punctata]